MDIPVIIKNSDFKSNIDLPAFIQRTIDKTLCERPCLKVFGDHLTDDYSLLTSCLLIYYIAHFYKFEPQRALFYGSANKVNAPPFICYVEKSENYEDKHGRHHWVMAGDYNIDMTARRFGQDRNCPEVYLTNYKTTNINKKWELS